MARGSHPPTSSHGRYGHHPRHPSITASSQRRGRSWLSAPTIGCVRDPPSPIPAENLSGENSSARKKKTSSSHPKKKKTPTKSTRKRRRSKPERKFELLLLLRRLLLPRIRPRLRLDAALMQQSRRLLCNSYDIRDSSLEAACMHQYLTQM
mmetsp:Transcript_19529/g.35922  ORF Transcript_19529/g.35922 Transcript_19529/m.35922 type:complete len:151 (-) Transcript_19529:12-464(-)